MAEADPPASTASVAFEFVVQEVEGEVEIDESLALGDAGSTYFKSQSETPRR